jgi:hypothetical protein
LLCEGLIVLIVDDDVSIVPDEVVVPCSISCFFFALVWAMEDDPDDDGFFGCSVFPFVA